MRTHSCSGWLLDALYMYCGEIVMFPLGLALKLSLPPSTLACLSSSSINLPK
jgi:hypothetical protein